MALPLRVWNGSEWINIGVQGGTVLYQNEEPASPQTGMIWIDADSETSVLNDEDYLTLSTASATYAPSASPTFTGEVNLPATTNYDGSLLSDTLASKLDLAGGKILQVVSATTGTTVSTTSTSYVTTNLTASITPSSASSKVLIMTHMPTEHDGQIFSGLLLALFRGTVAGTNLLVNAQFDAENVNASTLSYVYLDSPSTTSAQAYTLGVKTNSGLVTVKTCPSGRQASMVLMEVSA